MCRVGAPLDFRNLGRVEVRGGQHELVEPVHAPPHDLDVRPEDVAEVTFKGQGVENPTLQQAVTVAEPHLPWS